MAAEQVSSSTDLVAKLAVSTAANVREMRETNKQLVRAIAELKRGCGTNGSRRPT